MANSLIKGNSKSRPDSLTAVSSCPTDGTDDCIQLRLDAVGYAVNQLFVTANASMKVSNQFRIGLYPFIQLPLLLFSADQQHQRLSHQLLDHQLRRRKPCLAA